ncbi:hypothetical protein Tco_0012218 [Tanacetum coccineum]
MCMIESRAMRSSINLVRILIQTILVYHTLCQQVKILKVLRIILEVLPEHSSDTKVPTMKMEILLEPTSNKLLAVKRIFRYLKGQPKLDLWYLKDSPFDLEAYTDSDYASASLDRKSTIGDCQFLGSRLISWQCKKQTIVANSTTEA